MNLVQADEMLVLFAILAIGRWVGTWTVRRVSLGAAGVADPFARIIAGEDVIEQMNMALGGLDVGHQLVHHVTAIVQEFEVVAAAYAEISQVLGELRKIQMAMGINEHGDQATFSCSIC